MSPQVTFAPGLRVGNYELLVEIASGGTATVGIAVYRGAVGFERLVVVKRVHRHLAKDNEFTAMLIDEARLASSIRHPNVVPVTDVVHVDGEVMLVMDYVESVSLSQLMRRFRDAKRPVPCAIASRVLVDMLTGLHEAHEAVDLRRQALGIVHRDVSPQNVIVGIDGVSRVIDFGIAKARSRMAQTRAGHIKGKCAYMAPEQAEGLPVDRRCDVFASGIVLWEALTGARLFRGEDDFDEMRRVLKAPIPPPSSMVAGLPPDVDTVAAHALARPLDERFQTALAFARALEHAVPPAPARAVGEWVSSTCGAELELQRGRLASILGDELERLSPRGAAPGAAPVAVATTTTTTTTTTTSRTSSSGRGSTLKIENAPLVPRTASLPPQTMRSEEAVTANVLVGTGSPLEADLPSVPRRSAARALMMLAFAALGAGAVVVATLVTRARGNEAGRAAAASAIAAPSASVAAVGSVAVSASASVPAAGSTTAPVPVVGSAAAPGSASTGAATRTLPPSPPPPPHSAPTHSELKTNPYGP
jgi:serine/threonine protein kinase